ncbi:MCE family protein [Actinocorallia lasiicapitis]
MNRQRVAGLAFILVPALLIWLSIAVYQKKFTKVSWVTMEASTAGSELHPHTDVKLRGVVVGEVRSIDAGGSGARLKLAIKPDQVKNIPANVSAQLLPTTLFGTRYVALISPEQPSPERLVAGSVITEDRSSNATEIKEVLDNLLPLLQSIKPAELSATLSALAQALDGRGDDIAATVRDLNLFLKKLNPNLPALNRDIKELVEFTRNFENSIPELVDAVKDFTYTSKTIADQKDELSRLYSSVTGTSQELTAFLRENSRNLIRLSAHAKPGLQLFAKYSPEFPCTFQALADFVPKMDKILGKGTKNPGLHVNVHSVPAKAPYRPGKDKPVYNAKSGPRCYPVPYTTAKQTKVAAGGLGIGNSPQENQQVNELVAPGIDELPSALPDWTSVLLGPVYRGSEVRVS